MGRPGGRPRAGASRLAGRVRRRVRRTAQAAPCCGSRDLGAACPYHLFGASPDRTMPDGTPAVVAHACWALENGSTLQQAAAATGLSEQFVGLIARPLWSGPARESSG